MPKKNYHVVWEIDIFGVHTPEEAAKEALKIQQKRSRAETSVFDVTQHDDENTPVGRTVMIDLAD